MGWLKIIGAVALWEVFWWSRRRRLRLEIYRRALARARLLGRPLLVVGAPDRGPTSGYPCGDITIDIGPSRCPNAVQADITKRIPLDDNSVVVFVSCVLEYVDDFAAAVKELNRVAGNEIFVVGVAPWTLTSQLYPGARRTLAG